MTDKPVTFIQQGIFYKGTVAFGENIKLARLGGKLSAEQVSESANISRPTLLAIEKGQPGVAVGSCAQVLFVLNLEKDLLEVAADDVLGRKLQDAGIMVKKRAPKTTSKTYTKKA